MAVGFIASLLIYGGLLIPGKTLSLPTEYRPPRNSDNGHGTGITLGRRSYRGYPAEQVRREAWSADDIRRTAASSTRSAS
jgi:hypothetical protein